MPPRTVCLDSNALRAQKRCSDIPESNERAAKKPHSEHCCAYLDDIAIFSETLEEHMEHLEWVFETLERVILKVKMDKCQIARSLI